MRRDGALRCGNALDCDCYKSRLSRNYYGNGKDFENFRVVREFFSSIFSPSDPFTAASTGTLGLSETFFRPIPAYLRSLSDAPWGTLGSLATYFENNPSACTGRRRCRFSNLSLPALTELATLPASLLASGINYFSENAHDRHPPHPRHLPRARCR